VILWKKNINEMMPLVFYQRIFLFLFPFSFGLAPSFYFSFKKQ